MCDFTNETNEQLRRRIADAIEKAIPYEKVVEGLRAIAEQTRDPKCAARARKLAAAYSINLTRKPDGHDTDSHTV